MRIIAPFLLVVVLQLSVLGQEVNTIQLEQMKKLDFLVGTWEGEGWTEFMPGQRKTSPIVETVHSRLGGMIMVIEGLGKTKPTGSEKEMVVHNALAVVAYDVEAKVYRIRSYLASGRSTDAVAEFVDGGFQWKFQTPQGLTMKYTVKLTEKGEWFEIGEMSQDEKTWRKFHEMTLTRIN